MRIDETRGDGSFFNDMACFYKVGMLRLNADPYYQIVIGRYCGELLERYRDRSEQHLILAVTRVLYKRWLSLMNSKAEG